jgi:tryptophan synthase beta subunit
MVWALHGAILFALSTGETRAAMDTGIGQHGRVTLFVTEYYEVVGE